MTTAVKKQKKTAGLGEGEAAEVAVENPEAALWRDNSKKRHPR